MRLRFIAGSVAAALVVALQSQSARALQAERSTDPSESRIPVGSASLYARTIGRGQPVILSGAAMDLVVSAPSFAAGVGLWAASLAMVSASSTMPSLVRGIGLVGSLLFTVVAVQIFLGRALITVVGAAAVLRVSIPGGNTVWVGVGALPTGRLTSRYSRRAALLALVRRSSPGEGGFQRPDVMPPSRSFSGGGS